MKKGFFSFLIVILFFIFSCATPKKSEVQVPKEEKKEVVETTEVKTSVQELTISELLSKERFIVVISDFEKGKSDLPLGADAKIKEINMKLEKISQIAAKDKNRPKPVILVTGHCDRTGTEKFNDALSLKRAKEVALKLKKDGLEIKVKGKGFSELTDLKNPESPVNRRVEIRFDG